MGVFGGVTGACGGCMSVRGSVRDGGKVRDCAGLCVRGPRMMADGCVCWYKGVGGLMRVVASGRY